MVYCCCWTWTRDIYSAPIDFMTGGSLIVKDIDILTVPVLHRLHLQQDLFTVHSKIYCLNTSKFT